MKLWFVAIAALCALNSVSYAQDTKSQLNTYNNSVIVPNGVGAITASNLNPLLGAIINASCTIADPVNCPITALSGAVANRPLIGAASGGGVTQGTLSGNSTLFPTVDATPVSGNCAVFDSFGGLNNVACSPAGSGTVGAGLAGQLASYPSSGTSVAGATTGTGVLSAIGNNILAASGLAALDSAARLFLVDGQGNWLQTMMNNSVLGSYGYNNAGVFLGAGGSNGQGGVSGASRTSTFTASGGAIATSGFAFDDGGTFPDDPAFAMYSECRAYAKGSGGITATGDCVGHEIDSTNFRTSGTSPSILPYNAGSDGSTIGLHIASGGACSSGTGLCYDPNLGTLTLAATPSNVGLLIGPNGSVYQAGIVFGCNGIGTTNCAGGGVGVAIALYTGLTENWFAPSNVQTFQIGSTATTGTGQIVFTNSGLDITTSSGLSINGTPAVSCSGVVAATVTVVDGIVTHC